MKLKVLFTSLLMFLGVMFLNAQPQGGPGRMDPEQMAKMQTEHMATELGLNDKQKTEIEAINLKYAKKMQEIFKAGPSGDRETMRKNMEEINTSRNAEYKKVLTAEQYKKFEASEKTRQEERQKRMQEHGQRPNGQGAPQRGGAR